MFKKYLLLYLLTFTCLEFIFAQTNSKHVKVSGYTRKDGTYVKPYFKTSPNSSNKDNFSTKGNTNPYTGKPGWVNPDNKSTTFYYETYSYNNNELINSNLQIKYKDRTYIEDQNGVFTCYLLQQDERTFKIYDMADNLILYLIINHRGDWRIFDLNELYIKTIFVNTEKCEKF